MHAVSVALVHCAFGIEALIPGFSCGKRGQEVFFGPRPVISRSAAGSTVRLLAVGTNPVLAWVRW